MLPLAMLHFDRPVPLVCSLTPTAAMKRYFYSLSLFLLMVGCAAVSDRSAEGPAASTSMEAQPESQPAQTQQSVIKSGAFVPGEHPTEGTVRIVTQDNKPVLELDQAFKTSEMGPDLVVILHRSDDVLGSTKPPSYPLKEGDYGLVAPLEKFRGTQRYPIPETINLADYQSAVIWCRKFNATFGTAKLSHAGSAEVQ